MPCIRNIATCVRNQFEVYTRLSRRARNRLHARGNLPGKICIEQWWWLLPGFDQMRIDPGIGVVIATEAKHMACHEGAPSYAHSRLFRGLAYQVLISRQVNALRMCRLIDPTQFCGSDFI